MKKVILSTIVLMIFGVVLGQDSTLNNAALIGQSSRNQKVGKGLQVTDTLIVNGKARFNGRGVAIGGNYYPSAALSITDTSKGVLVPRLTAAQMAAIAAPANGLLVYNTSVNAFHFWNGSAWQLIGGGIGELMWSDTISTLATKSDLDSLGGGELAWSDTVSTLATKNDLIGIGGSIDTTHFGHIVETGGRYGDVYNTQTDFPTKYLGLGGKGAGFWKDAPGGFVGAIMFDNAIKGDSTYVHIGYINTSTFAKVGMSIEEQTDTTNAAVNLNAPTLALNASDMAIDADSVSVNASHKVSVNSGQNITLNADSNIYLNADSNIYIGASNRINITGDGGVNIATDSILHLYALDRTHIQTPKLILDGALEMIGIDSATLYATTPYDGTIRYCSDCTSNGITGKLVMRLGSMWRRLAFE